MLTTMRRKSFTTWPCSIARTVDLLGDAWTLLVLRELFYGETRFEGFVTTLGIARNTLTDRLTLLADSEVIERRAYQTDPVRHEYVLTDRGTDLFGVLAAINAWGDRWLAGDEGAPVTLHHDHCGHDLHAEVTCAHCREPVHLRDVSARMGPGFPAKLAALPAVSDRFTRATQHSQPDQN
jgi:DNA-binding HxlR family transcriptional regulator